MIIFRNTSKLLGWHHDVLGHCLRASPAPTVGLVAANVLGRILHTITFFLPLKIILLVGSPGVPHYLRFVAVEDKTLWVLVLTTLAVLSYLLTLALDLLSEILARRAAATFGGGSVAADPDSGEESTAERILARVCQSHGDLWFVAIALGFGLLFNMQLFLFVLGMLLIEGIILGIVVNSLLKDGGSRTDVLYRYWPGWSGIFTSVNFLLAFGMLLVQFMVLGYDNILLAVLSILLLRQMLGALSRYAQNGLWLWMWREYVEAIVKNERKYEPIAVKRLNRIAKLFSWRVRKKRMKDRLEREFQTRLQIPLYRWFDPLRRGPFTFMLRVHEGDSRNPRLLYERAYVPARQRGVQRELELDAAVPEGVLPRPPVVSRDTFEGVLSVLSEPGPGAIGRPRERDELLRRLLPVLWRIPPTDALLQAWCRSGHRLEERLSAALLRKMELATHNPRTRDDLAVFLKRRAALVAVIGAIPVFVYNANTRWANFYRCSDGRLLLLDWSEWAIAPVGTGLLDLRNAEAQAQRLAEEAGLALPDGLPLTGNHLLLVAHCTRMEAWIRRHRFKLALDAVPKAVAAFDRLQA